MRMKIAAMVGAISVLSFAAVGAARAQTFDAPPPYADSDEIPDEATAAQAFGPEPAQHYRDRDDDGDGYGYRGDDGYGRRWRPRHRWGWSGGYDGWGWRHRHHPHYDEPPHSSYRY